MPAEHLPTCDDMQPWLAARARGEADDDPAAREHLAGCSRCQADLTAYRRVAGVLPYAAPEAMPAPELRERLIAAVAPEAGANAPLPRADQPRPASPRLPLWRFGWAALALALVVALLGWNLSLRAQIGEQASEIARHRDGWQTTIRLLNDPSVRWYAVSGGQALGHLWATPQSREACFVAQGLPSIDDGQVLQVWVVEAGRHESAGTFEPRDGSGWVMLSAGSAFAGYDTVFVTVEPRGGSAAPSGPPVMQGSFAAAHTASLADRQDLLRHLGDSAQGSS